MFGATPDIVTNITGIAEKKDNKYLGCPNIT